MAPLITVRATRGRARAAALALVIALSGTACGDSDPAEPQAAASIQVRAPGAEIATAKGRQVAIYKEKDDAKPATSLRSPNAYGAARAFLVERNLGDWLHVLLPTRPNGSKGWIKAEDITLDRTTKRVEIDPKAFAFKVFDAQKIVRTGKVATGTGGTPTPPGRYYFTELLKPPGADGPYGPYAFGLSGHSPVLKSFAGGNGQLAVHGTNAPGKLGSQASHGCVRVSNDDITWMAQNLPIGTPVLIKA